MRQLAAIMFADMTGYTALMQANELLAVQKRRRLKEILETFIPQFNGKILQYYGDGSLSIFNSAIDAVRAATQMQQVLRQDPIVDVRIGLHVGDISIEEDAVFGDGVNLTSRIESLAVPGSVFISEKVYDEMKNQDGMEAVEMGYFELKNIKTPVRVFAIKQQGIVVPSRDEISGKTQQPFNRIAVMPFVNMSADPENEYFSDGITEELLNALTRVDGLQVTSRTSSFVFKGKHEDIREIATKLNVDKVLEGSVRKSGNRVRVTAQLINAMDGYHIWSETYDRDLTDIFAVQDEISDKIANKLRLDLSTGNAKSRQEKDQPRNIEPYNLFLKGLHYYNKLTPEDTFKAIEYFKQSVELDPGYAKPYAFIAAACAYLGVTGQMQTEKAFKDVHYYAQKALELDDTLAEGYAALGSAYLFHDWKWEEGFQALQKAIKLNPAGAQNYHLLALYHTVRQNKKEAVRLMEEAYAIDPLSPMVNHFLADMYLADGRYDDAISIADHTLELFPKMRSTMEQKGWALGMKNEWQAALQIFKEVQLLTRHPLKGMAPPGYAYGKLGMLEEALECVAKIEQRAAEDPNAVLDTDLAMVWWGIGDREKSISYMFSSIEKRLGAVAVYIHSPIFAGLQDHPSYRSLKKALNLPAEEENSSISQLAN